MIATCFPKDSDNDGIVDSNDVDSDNDGILDIIENNGILYQPLSNIDENQDGYDDIFNGTSPLDFDGDGIEDYLDLDSDNDGVLDKDDDCPSEAGSVANNGCPEIYPSDEALAQLVEYSRTINFAFDSAKFTDGTPPVLDAIVEILMAYPKANFLSLIHI